MKKKNLVMSGNYVDNSYFSMSGTAWIKVMLTDTGEDEVNCYVEDGILYEYVNDELKLCTNNFRLEYLDNTKK